MKSLVGLILLLVSHAWALNLREHALGDACYFIREKSSESMCHPTNIAREDDEFFFGDFFFSEGVHQANNWKRVIDGKASPEQIESLLNDSRTSYLMSETNMGLVGRSWAVEFKPYELWAKTQIQNPSNPYAHIDAGFAQVLALDFGHYLNENLSVGVKAEYAQIKTLDRSFFLTDLLAENNSVDLVPRTQNRFAFSPGIAFEPTNAWGNARYSVLWKQSYIDDSNQLYGGVSFLNDFSVGSLEWGLGTKFQESQNVEPLVFSQYRMGITTLTATIARDEQTYAAFLKVKGFDSGLSYFITDEDRTLLFQMGFVL
jgi:hypothetical protein